MLAAEWKSRAQLLPRKHQSHLPWDTAAGSSLALGHPGCHGFAPKGSEERSLA